MIRTFEPARFGAAMVEGIDPSSLPDDDIAATVQAELWARGVVCLRFDRPLSEPEARQVARLVGPIKDPIGLTTDGTELRYAEDRQIMDSGFVLTDEIREQLGDVSFGGDVVRPGLFEAFHTDDTFAARPAQASVLHARQLPSSPGGATSFLDMRVAYQRLDKQTQDYIDGLSVMYAYNNGGAFPPRPASTGPASALAQHPHPLVRRHRVTGNAVLYIDLDRATHVMGMPVDSGRALLQRLQDHAEAEAPRYDHTWRDHDVLIWDNAAVQHAARGDFPVGEPRRFWRFLIEGPVPV
jgi:alpha-ketoglutarate-dependent taurine dioxygenase